MNKIVAIGGGVPSNAAEQDIHSSIPYIAKVAIVGTADIIFHRWTAEAIDEKARAGKGSMQKKSDNIESYVYRNEDGEICLPGEYLRQSVIMAAKFRQDPRSPRKSAMDLYKAGVVALSDLAPLGKPTWDYLDIRRVVVQRSGVNRTRPAMRKGWEANFEFLINIPEYITPSELNDVISQAGRLVGVGDFRPTYGRFQVTAFSVDRG